MPDSGTVVGRFVQVGGDSLDEDEAGLTTTFQTWPPGCFHVAKHRDFPVPS